MRNSCITYPENDKAIVIGKSMENIDEITGLKKSNYIFIDEKFVKYKIHFGILLSILDKKTPKTVFEIANQSLGFLDSQQVRNATRKAISLGLINRVMVEDYDAFKMLKKSNSTNGCEFCGYDKSFLDKHHYPVRNRHGGKEAINICSNCHREFHQLTDHGAYVLNDV